MNSDPIGLFSLGQVAAAIGLDERQVRHLADENQIATLQFRDGGKRYVPHDELERLEHRGFRIDWTALFG